MAWLLGFRRLCHGNKPRQSLTFRPRLGHARPELELVELDLIRPRAGDMTTTAAIHPNDRDAPQLVRIAWQPHLHERLRLRRDLDRHPLQRSDVLVVLEEAGQELRHAPEYRASDELRYPWEREDTGTYAHQREGTQRALAGQGGRPALDQHPATIYRKVSNGSLPAVRLGAGRAAIRIDAGELDAWLEARHLERKP